MSGINKAIIVGRLGQDPELKTAGQNSVTTLSVATSEAWTDKQNQKQERTEWHRVVIWGKQAENAAKYLKKGKQVYIEGRLQTRSWEDDKGTKKYTTEIVAQNVQYLGDANSGGGRPPDPGPGDAPPQFDTNDEIPF